MCMCVCRCTLYDSILRFFLLGAFGRRNISKTTTVRVSKENSLNFERAAFDLHEKASSGRGLFSSLRALSPSLKTLLGVVSLSGGKYSCTCRCVGWRALLCCVMRYTIPPTLEFDFSTKLCCGCPCARAYFSQRDKWLLLGTTRDSIKNVSINQKNDVVCPAPPAAAPLPQQGPNGENLISGGTVVGNFTPISSFIQHNI